MSQKSKLKQYHQALQLIKRGRTQIEACKTAGISRMTFNKYRDMFGEEVAPGMYAAPVSGQDLKQGFSDIESKMGIKDDKPAVQGSDLERILAENNALAEQLKLRAELAKFMH